MNQGTLKVMIVDDEELSRKLILNSIDWAAYQLEVVADVSSSLEVLSLLEEQLPDIIFTDIRMPYMDGLELCQVVLEKYPHIKVVVLTAFKDFDYAQKSIRIGVSHFLLKPVNKLELHDTINKLREQIKKERNQWHEFDYLRKLLIDNFSILRERFLLEYLVGNTAFVSQHQLNYYYPDGIPVSVQVALLQSPQEHMRITHEEELLLKDMKNLEYVKKVLNENTDVEVIINHSHHIIIISYSEKFKILPLCEQIQCTIRTISGNEILFGIGSAYPDFLHLKRSYQEALDALKLCQYEASHSINVFQEGFSAKTNEWNIMQNDLYDLRFYIKAGLTEPLSELLPSLYLDKQQHFVDLECTRILSMTILSSALNAALDTEVVIDELFEGGSDSLVSTLSLTSASEMRIKTISYIEKITSSIANYRSNKNNAMLWEIIQYIQKEKSNPKLTLSSVAQKYYINDSYLSRMLKKELGFTFSKYLNRLRMEMAIQLLGENDMKVYQIAEIVGIPDAYYFSNCFKKYTGKSVREFKKGL